MFIRACLYVHVMCVCYRIATIVHSPSFLPTIPGKCGVLTILVYRTCYSRVSQKGDTPRRYCSSKMVASYWLPASVFYVDIFYLLAQ